ncbi:hypothetical protein CRENBAI_018933 [Crenichthys baileyi]|uniref:HD domain-containing protein n=1 Tax=Crenichthys baileyi TaxID=28760 RepID=A0AAV9SHI6_9TELE
MPPLPKGVTVSLTYSHSSAELHSVNKPPAGRASVTTVGILRTERGVKMLVFNDPIHRSVELHPLLVKIIDTPQFQRLRNIKQLGGKYYVYPGASHNRFEHSIGVAFLAGQLLQTLKEKQSDLKITKWDILCVQIAGLCHDLGHGPFSHLFDQMFIPKARPGETFTPKTRPGSKEKWKHEIASQEMFDHLVNENNLRSAFREAMVHSLNEEELDAEELEKQLDKDLYFIKELIYPYKIGPQDEWPYKGRTKEKAFLYEVVSNKRNEIDVDKWDYFARDCHHLGMKNNFDHLRLIKFARVCEVDGQMQICYRDKEVFNLYNMFNTRFCLYKQAYLHRVGNAIDWMITDAFLKADGHILIEGRGGRRFTLSTAICDMVAYTKLTDNVFYQILNSTSQELEEARNILDRIMCRELYFCLVEIRSEQNQEDIEAEWRENIPGHNPDNYVVDSVKFNYGMGGEDPIRHVRFYSKETPNETRTIESAEVSHLLPTQFQESLFRFYTKRSNEDLMEDNDHFRREFPH